MSVTDLSAHANYAPLQSDVNHLCHRQMIAMLSAAGTAAGVLAFTPTGSDDRNGPAAKRSYHQFPDDTRDPRHDPQA